MKWLERHSIAAIIISGFAFVIGNMTWHRWQDPSVMYIPLALFLFFLLFNAAKNMNYEKTPIEFILVQCLTVLSLGNIVKQLSYVPGIQKMDYWWGYGVMLVYVIWIVVVIGRREK